MRVATTSAVFIVDFREISSPLVRKAKLTSIKILKNDRHFVINLIHKEKELHLFQSLFSLNFFPKTNKTKLLCMFWINSLPCLLYLAMWSSCCSIHCLNHAFWVLIWFIYFIYLEILEWLVSSISRTYKILHAPWCS